ncbi:MAG: PilZ domain-containing protein [Terriglobales bacterium]
MLQKLQSGILHVVTDRGLHYVKPSFWERVRLVWIFRNFPALPQQVFSASHQRLLASLCDGRRMFRCGARNEVENPSIIGTLLTSVLPQPPNGLERRFMPRAALNFEVRYGLPGAGLFTGEGQDLSGGGMSFTGATLYPAGTELELRYRLASDDKWNEVRALVRHSEGECMRVKFLSFSEGQAPNILQVPAGTRT